MLHTSPKDGFWTALMIRWIVGTIFQGDCAHAGKGVGTNVLSFTERLRIYEKQP
jgi:hypothetical protein